MLTEIDQLNLILKRYDKELQSQTPLVARGLQILNEKIELIGGGIYDTLVDAILPMPEKVKFLSMVSPFIHNKLLDLAHIYTFA